VLDSWRGIAAFLVVGFHVGERKPLGTFVGYSWIFVDFFFVLSGFVIAAAYAKRLRAGMPLRRFALLRVGRLLPVHWLVLALWLAKNGLQAAFGIERAGNDQTLVGFIATLFLIQALHNPTPGDWSPQSWSISVEMLLYLAMALVCRWAGRFVFAVAAVSALAAIAILAVAQGTADASIDTDIVRGVAGFGSGVCAWWLWQAGLGERARCAHAGLMALLELLAAAMLVVFVSSELPTTGSPLAPAVFSLVILVFAGERGPTSRLLASTPFVWLGILSYSLYMIHVLALAGALLVERLATQFDVARAIVGSAFGFLALTAAMSLAAAWVLWRFVEAPSRAWSRKIADFWGVGREESVSPAM